MLSGTLRHAFAHIKTCFLSSFASIRASITLKRGRERREGGGFIGNQRVTEDEYVVMTRQVVHNHLSDNTAASHRPGALAARARARQRALFLSLPPLSAWPSGQDNAGGVDTSVLRPIVHSLAGALSGERASALVAEISGFPGEGETGSWRVRLLALMQYSFGSNRMHKMHRSFHGEV